MTISSNPRCIVIGARNDCGHDDAAVLIESLRRVPPSQVQCTLEETCEVRTVVYHERNIHIPTGCHTPNGRHVTAFDHA